MTGETHTTKLTCLLTGAAIFLSSCAVTIYDGSAKAVTPAETVPAVVADRRHDEPDPTDLMVQLEQTANAEAAPEPSPSAEAADPAGDAAERPVTFESEERPADDDAPLPQIEIPEDRMPDPELLEKVRAIENDIDLLARKKAVMGRVLDELQKPDIAGREIADAVALAVHDRGVTMHALVFLYERKRYVEFLELFEKTLTAPIDFGDRDMLPFTKTADKPAAQDDQMFAQQVFVHGMRQPNPSTKTAAIGQLIEMLSVALEKTEGVKTGARKMIRYLAAYKPEGKAVLQAYNGFENNPAVTEAAIELFMLGYLAYAEVMAEWSAETSQVIVNHIRRLRKNKRHDDACAFFRRTRRRIENTPPQNNFDFKEFAKAYTHPDDAPKDIENPDAETLWHRPACFALLQSGKDAYYERNIGLARAIFKKIVLLAPDSPEAAAAEGFLKRIDGGSE